MQLHEGQKTLISTFETHTTAFGTSKGNAAVNLRVSVNPDSASMELVSNLLSPVKILSPHTSAKSILGVISPINCLLDGFVGHHWKHRAKLLLINNAHTLLDIAEHHGLNHEALRRAATRRGYFTANHFCAVVERVNEKLAHLVILHRVIERAEHDIFLKSVAEGCIFGDLSKSLKSILVNSLIHVDTLGSNADLTTVTESCAKEALGSLLGVYILEHNGRIVAAKLKSDTLEGFRCGLHDLLASRGASSERDLVNTRVLNHPCAKLSFLTGHNR
mmetsp:Transcript_528/g.1324  ORF Transcript_528/g.1324 Transcript_528/m.1324 type:complete len:275 (+) Transcript_528:173-997(+)